MAPAKRTAYTFAILISFASAVAAQSSSTLCTEDNLDSLTMSIPLTGLGAIDIFEIMIPRLQNDLTTGHRIEHATRLVDHIDSTLILMDKEAQSAALYFKGLVLNASLNMKPQAVQAQSDALKIAEEIGNNFMIYLCTMPLAANSFRVDNYGEVIRLGNAALTLEKKLDSVTIRLYAFHTFNQAISLRNIIAISHNALGNYDSAMYGYRQGLDVIEKVRRMNIPKTRCEFWNGIFIGGTGKVYQALGQYAKALPLVKKSIWSAVKVNDWTEASESATIASRLSTRLGRFDDAERYLDSIEMYLGHTPNRQDFIRTEMIGARSELEAARGNYKLAYELNSKYAGQQRKLARRQQADDVASLQASFDYDQNRREISRLSSENNVKEQRIRLQWLMFTAAIIVVLLLIVLAFTFIRSFGRQKRINKIIKGQHEEIKVAMANLRAAQDQLVQSEKMASIGQLTAGLLHEINNPVNFIQSGTEALKENLSFVRRIMDEYETSNPDNFNEKSAAIQKLKRDLQFDGTWAEIEMLIKTIGNGASRTASIVSGLGRFSTARKGSFIAINIKDPIDDTLFLINHELKGRIGIELHYEENIFVMGNIVELQQVFMNLIMNAVQAMNGNGKLFITTKNENEMARISIRDTGPGIPPEIQSKIFDPFFTTKDVGKGTGLGLSITHGIIKNHGGEISIATSGPGGTEFVILLPLT